MSTALLNIAAALDTKLSTLAGSWPIAWENVEYRPTALVSHLRPTFLPASARQADLGSAGRNFLTGVYQVDIFTPTGPGRAVAIAKADAVVTHFKRGTSLTSGGYPVTCVRAVAAPGRVDGAWYIVSVSVYWRAYADN